METQFEIRNLQRGEIGIIRELTDDAKWNLSEEYMTFCYDSCPRGFFVAVTPSGEILGHCAAIAAGENLGFIAFFITRPGYRGRGIGVRVLQACLSFLGERNVSLVAGWDTERLYASKGYRFSTYRIHGYMAVPNYQLVESLPCDDTVVVLDAQQVPFKQLAQYDQTFCPIERSEFLRRWISPSRSKTYVAMRMDTICGYVCRWQSAKGYRIMPLYANDLPVARMLFKSIVASAPIGSQFEVGCPLDNAEGADMFSSVLTPQPQKKRVRMFTKEVVPVDCTRTYSICGYDLVVI